MEKYFWHKNKASHPKSVNAVDAINALEAGCLY